MQVTCSKCEGTGSLDFDTLPKKFGAQQVLFPEMNEYLDQFKQQMLMSAIMPIIRKYKLDTFNIIIKFYEETRDLPGFESQRFLIMRGLLDAEQTLAADPKIKMNEEQWDRVHEKTDTDIMTIVMDVLHGRLDASACMEKIAKHCSVCYEEGFFAGNVK